MVSHCGSDDEDEDEDDRKEKEVEVDDEVEAVSIVLTVASRTVMYDVVRSLSVMSSVISSRDDS